MHLTTEIDDVYVFVVFRHDTSDSATVPHTQIRRLLLVSCSWDPPCCASCGVLPHSIMAKSDWERERDSHATISWYCWYLRWLKGRWSGDTCLRHLKSEHFLWMGRWSGDTCKMATHGLEFPGSHGLGKGLNIGHKIGNAGMFKITFNLYLTNWTNKA